ncbi:mCG18013, isoform CRA_a, partial [Mus musculus]
RQICVFTLLVTGHHHLGANEFSVASPANGLPLRTLGNVVRREQAVVSCRSEAGTGAPHVFAARFSLPRAPEVLPFPVVCSSGSFWNMRRLCHGNTIRVVSFRCDLGTLSSPWQLSES